MQLSREALNAVMAGGGYNAANWTQKRVQDKVKALGELFDQIDEKLEAEGEKGKPALADLRALMRAVNNKETITVLQGKGEDATKVQMTITLDGSTPVATEAAPAAAATTPVAQAVTGGATAQPAPAATVTPAPAGEPAKKKGPPKGTRPPASAGTGRGDGVIGTIEALLRDAGKAGVPVTKKTIGEKLHAKFPDRPLEAMMKTVQVQVPNRLRKDKKLDVQKNDSGYWIPFDPNAATAAPVTTPAPVAETPAA